MILRVSKLAITGVALWYILSDLHVNLPDTINVQWQTGPWPHATCMLRTAGASLEAVLSLITLSNSWHFRSKQTSGGRQSGLRHKRAFLYASVSYLFLMLLSVAASAPLYLNRPNLASLTAGMIVVWWAAQRPLGRSNKEDSQSVYGLQHGRLHLDTHVPMWMNMGYWKVSKSNTSESKNMAEACRDLLKLVLAEAGFTKSSQHHPSRLLIDAGFGCGEQTIHLMSDKPIRPCDELWWDKEEHQLYFDQYIGITQDKSQFRYAQDRIDELNRNSIAVRATETSLFCADAANPAEWNDNLLIAVKSARSKSPETWLLALDSAYHFSPSRWVLIEHARQESGASLMAFDLCLSPNATILQKLVLRAVTALMGAPWVNFVTPELYRLKLRDIGYDNSSIKVIDISEHVFAPLAEFMDKQDRKLKMLGLGLGSFKAAKALFRWWGSTGVVRGVVVIARNHGHHQ